MAKTHDPMNSSPAEEEVPAPQIKKQAKKVADDEEAGREAESGSGSDSDLPPPPPAKKGITKPDPTIDEARSKEAPPKNPMAVKPSSPPPAKKRQAEEGEEKEGEKRMKNNNGDGQGEDSKSKLFQRIWSEDDEIVILQGLADYRSKKGADPFADLNDFYNFIKNSLHVDVSKAQLSAKSRRLRQKFENNVVREKKGKVRSLSNPHEKRAYELSKMVWPNATGLGNSNGEGTTSGVKSKSKSKSTVEVIGQGEKKGKSLADGIVAPKGVSIEQNLSLSFQISAEGLPLSQKVIMKDGLEHHVSATWKELALQEMELYLRRVELIKFQTKLVMDAIKEANK